MTQLVEAIGQASIVPVQTDLSSAQNALDILRGFERANRKDRPIQAATALNKGEWGVLHDDGTVSRATSTPVRATYLCFAGTRQFDSAATGNVTLFENSLLTVQTTMYDPAPTYHVGDGLTVKDLGGGESYVTKSSGTEPVLARVKVPPTNGVMVYDTVVG